MNYELTAVDLFCGCGGLSEGLRRAGVRVVAGVDVEPKYIASFQHNFPEVRALIRDVSSLSPEMLCSQLGITQTHVDILVGGPPCQGFSKNVPRRHRWLDDPKNGMVRQFLDVAEFLLPPLVVMENVAEMRNGFGGHYAEEVSERLSAVGYRVQHFSLNAADFGVPQRRRRAFFVANRLNTAFSEPRQTHFPAGPREGELFDNPFRAHVSVWDAIGDLPSLRSGEGESPAPYGHAATSEFQHWARDGSCRLVNHVARDLRPTQLERITALKPGQGMKDLPEHLRTKGGYSGAYGRLTKDMIAPTITRWVFHPGSGRWGHPVDDRILTIREAARIQGFPDSFHFVGSYNDQAGQIGNAVPPLLAEAFFRHILSQPQVRGISRARSSNDSLCSLEGSLNAAE